MSILFCLGKTLSLLSPILPSKVSCISLFLPPRLTPRWARGSPWNYEKELSPILQSEWVFLKSDLMNSIVRKVRFFSFNSTCSWKTGPMEHSWVPEGTWPALEIIILLSHESSIFPFMGWPCDKLLTIICSGAGRHVDATPGSKDDETGTESPGF